jgi:CHAT domain-containing protein/Tfp pilus assembly protein PilF
LQRRAEELVKQARQLAQQGKYPDAIEIWKQIIPIYQQLYPKSRYPDGHADLASALNNLALLLLRQQDYTGAQAYFQQSLEMRQALYPKEKYPKGHAQLATIRHNMGSLLLDQGDYAGALGYFQRALDMRRALYPKETHPHGHHELSVVLDDLGLVLMRQGDYPGARRSCEQALAMWQALYPKETHPHGHVDLAISLDNLGTLLMDQGEFAGARNYHEQAVHMRQALYPKTRFPHGHPDLAISLNNMGGLLYAEGDYAGARGYYQQALAIYQAFYPKEQFPRGHSGLAQILNNLGMVLEAQGEHLAAGQYLHQALSMRQALFPKDQFPAGHPDLAESLNNVGLVRHRQGDDAGARRYYEQALDMNQALYPKQWYPFGHPRLAFSLYNLGTQLAQPGQYGRAISHLEEALDMYLGLAEILMPVVSEAEAMNHLSTLPQARDVFLSACQHLRDSDAACYDRVWRGKGVIFGVLRSRQQALRPVMHAENQDLWEQLVQTRRDLARLILSPPRDPGFHMRRLQELTERKEKLERQLSERSAPFHRQQESERLTPTDLVRKLPQKSVFVDLLRYDHFEQDPRVPAIKGERWGLRYVAFVMRPGQMPLRVEIGEANPIDSAVAAWRRDLARRPTSDAAETLRRLVWDRLAPHLPADTQTVLVASDGALTQLPWAALPGERPGSVLLEDYAFAVVPNGPFLLERLTAAPESEPDSGQLLAVGGVQYDQPTRPLPEPQPEYLVAWRPAERGSGPLWSAERTAGVVAAAGAGPFQVLPFLLLARPSWSYLPGTLREIEAVSKLADPRPVQLRRGTEANTAQLLQDLPQARYALLATHGFFADPQFRSVFLLDEAAFRHHGPEGRATPGARNPLVLSGLVLAGANRPLASDPEGMAAGDGSILTAEMIASLPLEHLELVVLSACETGLGEVAGGEGVYGLQRAFHLAGAQTTVASLWQVDDEITQELLTRFFENLWHHGMGRLEALRQAQLAVRRGEGNRAQPRYWAAWVLSGDPGDLDPGASAVRAERPVAVVAAPWWSNWPWYATGLGALGALVLGLVALRYRRGAR